MITTRRIEPNHITVRNVVCTPVRMAIAHNRMVRWGGARLSHRLGKSMPIIGAAVAVATVYGTMRRKGLIGGAFDTAFNALPFVGAAKNAVEVARGRDFFPDRVPAVGARR
jgi:hypothetical protein